MRSDLCLNKAEKGTDSKINSDQDRDYLNIHYILYFRSGQAVLEVGFLTLHLLGGTEEVLATIAISCYCQVNVSIEGLCRTVSLNDPTKTQRELLFLRRKEKVFR